MSSAKRILLTTISASPRENVNYQFNNQVAIASQAPVALIKLLPIHELPDKVIILCTQKLYDEQYETVRNLLLEYYDQILCNTLNQRPDVTEVRIPDGRTVEELWQILEAVLHSIPHNCELTLDVTHGYRSFPFLYFTAALFLKALRGVQIKAVYYAMLESEETEKPIIDLSLLLDMVEWFYATRIFHHTGQASPLCELLRPLETPPAGVTGKDNAPYQLVKSIRRALENVSAAYAQALPLELGREAEQLLRRITQPIPRHMEQKVPLATELFGSISSFAGSFALPATRQRRIRIKEVELNLSELTRQSSIIDSYLKQGYVNYALGMIREWMVSCAMWNQMAEESIYRVDWWIGHKRFETEHKFAVLARTAYKADGNTTRDIITPEQRWLASKWQFFSDKRNQLAHHGFRYEYVLHSPQQIDEIRAQWEELKSFVSSKPHWNLEIKRGQGTLLLSPLGLSKGLLFSALHHIRPDEVFVVTSEESAISIEEITNRADWSGRKYVYKMKEPFTGFAEAKTISRELQNYILKSDRIIANITGGTTAMQYVIQQVTQDLRLTGIETEIIAIVDRRTPAEQVETPYVPGEIIYIEGQGRLNPPPND
ncbi:MAG: TIGR02221 family CRISPR-associated protein [Syntrophomonadaceae bacterium]|jgi:CRISPR-associated Csx2 family protein|nr:TIGR02221 family CRISPR-associated protein [Syntrophomonadaceae bacterium]